MKKQIIMMFAATAALLSACHEPDELIIPEGIQGLNSVSAQFATGDYKNDATAKFTTLVTEANKDRIVIDVPWFFPESSDNRSELSQMRVTANIDNNCSITPMLGTLDLTQENWFTLIHADGSTHEFCITGNLKKSDKCEIITFTTDTPAITGIIDNDLNTISLISADDLSAVTAQVILSPHATITPDPAVAANYEGDGMKFTVTANDGVTKRVYTVSKQVPPKVKYGWRAGSEKEVWQQTALDKLGIVNAAGKNYSLAASGDKLILSTGADKYLFKRATGDFIGAHDMKGVSANGCVTSDDAGNILYATQADPNAEFRIYTAESTDQTPTQLLSYTNATGASMGKHISVSGDVKGDAIVTAVIYTWNGVTCKFLRWVITGGVVAKPEMVTVTGATAGWNGNGHADVEASSSNPDDPYYLSYYSANKLFRVDATGAVTSSIGTATWGANSNYNCVDVCTFNQAKYAAIYTGSHFTYGEFKAYMFDVTSPAPLEGLCDTSPSKVFVSGEYKPAAGVVNATSDVLMVASPDGYKLSLYYTDGNTNALVAWEFDCIDK
ncbi:DUF5018 domain-containing protein [Alistipes sp.]|uniref:DUF5018 domain-containing protein n=1 Tax=Alistipes sp. TaxID=1872444 RepID=UPI003AF093D9